MEDVRTVFMNMDSFHVLGVYVARDICASVDHKHLFPACLHLVRKNRTIQSRANDQIIVHHRFLLSFPTLSATASVTA